MVYIRINSNIQASVPKKLLRQKQPIIIQQTKYIKYTDFKQLSKLSNQSLHKYVQKNDIISQIDINRMLELSQRTPQQKKMIQQLKNKHQYRVMTGSTSNKGITNHNCQSYYYGNQSPEQGGNNIKELTDSVSFGVTFIFSFFMAGVTGYFFAQYFFQFQLTGRLMVSIVFIFATIFVQTWLYIIKQTKANKKLERQRKQWQKDQSLKAEYSIKSKLKYRPQTNTQTKIKKQ